MTQLKLTDVDPVKIYDIDDAAEVLGVHRTTIHRSVFPKIRTQKIGRRLTTTGAQLIKYLCGETDDVTGDAA